MHRLLSVMLCVPVLVCLSGLDKMRASLPSSAPVPQKGQSRQDIAVSLMVPDLAWRIHIDEIYIVGTELWVISMVERSEASAAQMLTTITDSVTVSAPSLPIKHFIVGKQWHWENPEPYVFLQARSQIKAQLKRGKKIFMK